MHRNRKNIIQKIILTLSAAVALTFIILLLFFPSPLFKTPYSSVLYSREGLLLGARVSSDGQWRFQSQKQVPEKIKQCIVNYEDKRFYHHFGIDKWAVARALVLNMRNRRVVSGASTISMQVVRLATDKNGKRSLLKKIKESVMAVILECLYSKDEILELYAANAPFGGNVVGLEAASYRYFGCDPSSLSWGEAAALAVLPNSPSLIHPGRNRNALKLKRDNLLHLMYKRNVIDADSYFLATEEPLPGKPHRLPMLAYHYMERKIGECGAGSYVSDISYDLQRRATDIAQNYVNYYSNNGVNNIAVLVQDVKSGEPIVYLGNVTPNAGGGSNVEDPSPKMESYGSAVDIINAPRSSGSTLKPLLYMAMLQDGDILPTMLVRDIPVKYKNFSPHNFNKQFEGAVPAHSVLERSLNVPSVKMLDMYGIDKFLELLKRLGFSTLNRSSEHYGLSLILGGGEITLYDLSSAYRTLAFSLLENDSVKRTPESVPLIDRGAVWLTFNTLSNLNRPEEEGGSVQYSSYRKIAWKTGTSWGNRDAWSVGITPEYVVAVWVGNANGEGRPNLTGVSAAAPIMFDIFSILGNTTWFEMPQGELEEISVCSKSGHPASSRCMGNTESILVPIAPKRPDPCPYHKIIHTDSTLSHIVNSNCYPVSDMKEVSWFILPPSQEWYYKQNHVDYLPLPPLHPDFYKGSMDDASSLLEILYPLNGMTVIPTTALGGIRQGVIFKAYHNSADALIFWYIDDKYIASTSWPHHQINTLPSIGSHRLTIIDDKGNSTSVFFKRE